LAGLNSCSRQFEFTLAAVAVGHSAVQHVPRVTPQVGRFPRPRMAPMSS
jgi:hypothetical protein